MANRCIDKVSIDANAFCGLLKRNNMYVTGKNGLDLVLDREAKTIRRWLKAGEIPVSMVDDICNALKCKKEEFIMETDKKWYLFEGDAEGRRADVMLLSEEEAKLVSHVLDHMIHMVDEGYSGCLYMRDDLGGFDSKEDVFKAYCEENPWVRSDDVCEEFRYMYKEEEE